MKHVYQLWLHYHLLIDNAFVCDVSLESVVNEAEKKMKVDIGTFAFDEVADNAVVRLFIILIQHNDNRVSDHDVVS